MKTDTQEVYYEMEEDESNKRQDKLFSLFAIGSLLFCVFLVFYCRRLQGSHESQPVEIAQNLKNFIQSNLEVSVGDEAVESPVASDIEDVASDIEDVAPAVKSNMEKALGTDTCHKHSDCGSDQYCFGLHAYRTNMVGTGGRCAALEFCCDHNDAIDNKCPANSGCAPCDSHDDCSAPNTFCADKDNTCKFCEECKFNDFGIDNNCGKCNGPTLKCDNHEECKMYAPFGRDFCNADQKCGNCSECTCENGIDATCGLFCDVSKELCNDGFVLGYSPTGPRTNYEGITDEKTCTQKCGEGNSLYCFWFDHENPNRRRCLGVNACRTSVTRWFRRNNGD
jgi:hypothetical protein